MIKKSLIDPITSSIQIDANNCYTLDMQTVKGNEMVVEAAIEGEYRKDLVLYMEEHGNTVFVSAGFQPNFTDPNDKLSVHRVISIALKIQLPEQKTVKVYGTNSNIRATGSYKDLTIALSDGMCVLNNVTETAQVITQSGDIFVKTSHGEIVAETKYGKIRKEAIPKGNNHFALFTITGNIHLKKTE